MNNRDMTNTGTGPLKGRIFRLIRISHIKCTALLTLWFRESRRCKNATYHRIQHQCHERGRLMSWQWRRWSCAASSHCWPLSWGHRSWAWLGIGFQRLRSSNLLGQAAKDGNYKYFQDSSQKSMKLMVQIGYGFSYWIFGAGCFKETRDKQGQHSPWYWIRLKWNWTVGFDVEVSWPGQLLVETD